MHPVFSKVHSLYNVIYMIEKLFYMKHVITCYNAITGRSLNLRNKNEKQCIIAE